MVTSAGRPPLAILFDLDDTLFEQADWLAGAWKAVAAAGAPPGPERERLEAALIRIAGEGSARGRIIDRALEAAGWSVPDMEPLLRAFRTHRPERLDTYPGVRPALAHLRRRVPIGLVTDGDPAIQRSKINALGLNDSFDAVVLSDELGREHRKPHPAPFLLAVERLGLAGLDADDRCRVVFVGDRPDKDVAGAMGVGLTAIRVLTGEYRLLESSPAPAAEYATAADAVAQLLGSLGAPSADLST